MCVCVRALDYHLSVQMPIVLIQVAALLRASFPVCPSQSISSLIECPLTGDLSSSACVCGCVVNGVSATAAT